MDNTFEFKNLSEVEQLAAPTADTTVMGFEAGKPVQLPASAIKGGSVFVIDSAAEDYSLTSTEYGNKVKEALLRGDTVYVYQHETYTNVVAFGIVESTTGASELKVYPSAMVNTTSLTLNDKFGNASLGYISFAITL